MQGFKYRELITWVTEMLKSQRGNNEATKELVTTRNVHHAYGGETKEEARKQSPGSKVFCWKLDL